MYDGTNYLGWQTQAKGQTIQGEIEVALGGIYSDDKLSLIGSSRTDSGVHALGQIAHFEAETSMKPNQIIKAINSKLKRDIWIEDCMEVDGNFHARFSAKKRKYIYIISSVFTPFERNKSWFITWDININKMQECAKMILGEHDFTCFCKATAEVNHKICTIINASWEQDKEKLFFNISANRFLQHMVRFLVGTMIEVGRGRYSIDDFSQFINGRHPKLAVVRAPAHGLFLKEVIYE
jgi:tRNA pseudouridine38-40 synthase